MGISVIKKDRSSEELNPDKIKRVVKAAGLTDAEADILTQKVIDWVNNLGRGEVKTSEIREVVLQELKNVNSYAAGLYEWYEKTKEAPKN